MNDLNEIEENGVMIDGSVAKGTVCAVTGDNLGSHNVGCFTENVSTS